MESNHGKISLWLHALIWIIGAIIATPILYWLLDDSPPIVFVSAMTNMTTARQGTAVMTSYIVDIKRNSKTCLSGVICTLPDCSIEAERSWTDADGRVWPSPTVHLSYAEGRNMIGLTMVIPPNAVFGAADVTNAILWSCNPLQRLWPRRLSMPPLTVVIM